MSIGWNLLPAGETRVAIIGNSGSGKSTLAQAISAESGLGIVSFDDIFWEPGGFNQAKSEARQLEELRFSTRGSSWIAEGVFGKFIEEIFGRASSLIWMDLPWKECQEGIFQRAAAHGREREEALVEWASNYWSREGRTSFRGHERFFENFPGPSRMRLRSREQAASFIAGIRDGSYFGRSSQCSLPESTG